MVPEQDLLDRIEKFIAAVPEMTEWSFGRAALKDTNLVSDLRAGRELRSSTRKKVEAYMEETLARLAEAVHPAEGQKGADGTQLLSASPPSNEQSKSLSNGSKTSAEPSSEAA